MANQDIIINIGSKVTISDVGEIYTTYWAMMQELGFKDPKMERESWLQKFRERNDGEHHSDEEYTVFSRYQHYTGIESGDTQVLIGVDGLKLVKEKTATGSK